MTASRDPDRLIHQFVLEGEEQLDDQVFDAVRAEIEQKPQRVFVGPWRMPIMNKIVAIGLGSAAVVAVLLVGSSLLGPSSSTAGDGAVGIDCAVRSRAIGRGVGRGRPAGWPPRHG